jgi:hypothetical protein
MAGLVYTYTKMHMNAHSAQVSVDGLVLVLGAI